MSTRYKAYNRDQMTLLPYDLRDWLPEDDLVHFVIGSVDLIPLERFQKNVNGTGSEQYHPHMMLSLLIYCYSNGVFGSRRIERSTYRDIAVRYLCANTHPDHDTICRFRRENFEAVNEAFLAVLKLAKELKMLKVGTVSVDGTKIQGSASKDKNIRYDRSVELEEQLKHDISELMHRAEQADTQVEVDGQSLPVSINRREKLLAKISEAKETLEKRAKARAETEREAYMQKLAAREQRTGSSKAKMPKPPDEHPRDEEQVNMTDSESRLMRKNKRSGYMQGYNPQAAVDADGSQLILGARVTRCASDKNELEKDIRSIPEEIGKPDFVLADNGYASEDEVTALEEDGVEVLVSVHSESKENSRKYDFRPLDKIKKKENKNKPQAKEWIKRMADKMETKEAKKRYRYRKQTVEPVFGIIKSVLGFRQFLLRGLENVSGEWMLIATAYNFKRLHSMKMA